MRLSTIQKSKGIYLFILIGFGDEQEDSQLLDMFDGAIQLCRDRYL